MKTLSATLSRRASLRVATLLAALFSFGCASVEGVFEPSCIAYAGDRIEFRNDRFEWSRFTDVRNIDRDGNEIDAFPDYPKAGTYKIDSATIEFVTDDGSALDDHFLLERNGDLYLLTREQHDAVTAGESMPDCALRRGE
ncbi:MAG: hypothetical protein AAGE85_15590 [Pseudomonadota bacterium]